MLFSLRPSFYLPCCFRSGKSALWPVCVLSHSTSTKQLAFLIATINTSFTSPHMPKQLFPSGLCLYPYLISCFNIRLLHSPFPVFNFNPSAMTRSTEKKEPKARVEEVLRALNKQAPLTVEQVKLLHALFFPTVAPHELSTHA